LIDLHVGVTRPDRIPTGETHPGPESSAEARRRAIAAREIQLQRTGFPHAPVRDVRTDQNGMHSELNVPGRNIKFEIAEKARNR
jgi:hypothetical protein